MSFGVVRHNTQSALLLSLEYSREVGRGQGVQQHSFLASWVRTGSAKCVVSHIF